MKTAEWINGWINALMTKRINAIRNGRTDCKSSISKSFAIYYRSLILPSDYHHVNRANFVKNATFGKDFYQVISHVRNVENNLYRVMKWFLLFYLDTATLPMSARGIGASYKSQLTWYRTRLYQWYRLPGSCDGGVALDLDFRQQGYIAIWFLCSFFFTLARFLWE